VVLDEWTEEIGVEVITTLMVVDFDGEGDNAPIMPSAMTTSTITLTVTTTLPIACLIFT
jgi:hypothetical protein